MAEKDAAYVFVHDENGRCVGAGRLLWTTERRSLSGPADDGGGAPGDLIAYVSTPGMSRGYLVPTTRLTNFPQHPGYSA